MQLTIQLHNLSDLDLLLAFLQLIGAEVLQKTPAVPTAVSAVHWLETLAQEGGIKSIPDPSAWQRETRQTRSFQELMINGN